MDKKYINSSNVEKTYISNKNYFYKIVNSKHKRISKREFDILNKTMNSNYNTQSNSEDNSQSNSEDNTQSNSEYNTQSNSEYNTQSNNETNLNIFEDDSNIIGGNRNIDKTNTLINTINKQDGGGFWNNNDKLLEEMLQNEYDRSTPCIFKNYYSKSLTSDNFQKDQSLTSRLFNDPNNTNEVVEYTSNNFYQDKDEVVFKINHKYIKKELKFLVTEHPHRQNFSTNILIKKQTTQAVNLLNNYNEIMEFEHDSLKNSLLDYSIDKTNRDMLFKCEFYYKFKQGYKSLENHIYERPNVNSFDDIIDKLVQLHNDLIEVIKYLHEKNLCYLNISSNSIIFDESEDTYKIINFENIYKFDKIETEPENEGYTKNFYSEHHSHKIKIPILDNVHYLSSNFLKRILSDKSLYINYLDEEMFSIGTLLYRVLLCNPSDKKLYDGLLDTSYFRDAPIQTQAQGTNIVSYLNYLKDYLDNDIDNKLRTILDKLEHRDGLLDDAKRNFQDLLNTPTLAVGKTDLFYKYLDKISKYLEPKKHFLEFLRFETIS